MPAKRLLTTLIGTLLVLFGVVVGSTPVQAASHYKVIHASNRKETGPYGGLVEDAAGNLFGAATVGQGNDEVGAVFELTPGPNGQWTEKLIYILKDNGVGLYPEQGLTIDAAGNLYGTTAQGGDYHQGIAFELTPGADGNWTFKVLHSFGGGDECPCSVMTLDAAGNLYGTTSGEYGVSAVLFELSPSENGEWTESVLFNFFPKAGLKPSGGLIFDAAGNLYGTTSQGGHTSDDCNASSCGVVFELSPGANGQWTETLLHSFEPGDGGSGPASGLIFDAAGNLYGSTDYGGKGCADPRGCGTIFKLTPAANGTWTHRPLHSFRTLTEGVSKLVFDNAGNLYGTTYQGGKNLVGTIFKLTPSANRAWTVSVQHNFNNKSGYLPYGGLTFDAASGNLYGTAALQVGGGVVFELTP